MPKDDALTFEGIVLDICKDKFRVQVNERQIILAVPSGKLRQSGIKVVVGDVVRVEVSPYDLSLGRIVYRIK